MSGDTSENATSLGLVQDRISVVEGGIPLANKMLEDRYYSKMICANVEDNPCSNGCLQPHLQDLTPVFFASWSSDS